MPICRLFCVCLSLLAFVCGTADRALAQGLSDDGDFVINLRNADISALAEQVSEITARTLVVDPALAGEVTVISAEALSQAGVWELFQSILRVRGFVAVESGVVWEIVSEADARTKGMPVGGVLSGRQDTTTRIVELDRLPAEEAVRVLRPLVAEAGYIEALSDPNAIIVTDTRANVERIVEIARTFDGPENLRTEVVRFNYADADAVLTAINDVLGSAGTGARLSSDPTSNTLLVRGTEVDIAMVRDLVRDMDVAPRAAPQAQLRTYVYELQYADAEVVAEVVNGTLGGATELTNPVAQAVGDGEDQPGVALPEGPAPAVAVQASTQTNAVVIRGTARQIEEVIAIVRSLDKERAQVMIEAAIVEVSGEIGERLGVQLGFADNLPNTGFASTSFSQGGASLSAVLSALGVPGASGLTPGLTLAGSSDEFGVLVQALGQSTRANLLSTPSITTMDNQSATIIVGQNVPFRTGSFATDGNTLTPFTTIERQDVGITMEVLPRVTSNGVVRLDISQEVSSLVNANVQGAADLITNRRLIETTVQSRDGGTIVLGGLITDDAQSSNSKVPGLGDVPVLGNIFRSRNVDQTRRTLFVFMRPTVIDSEHKARAVADRRYQRLRSADAAEPPRSLLKERKVKKLPLEINGLY
ncbi:Type II secretion system protein D precursor [Roseivivax jejudonensis]|uniref:Type II secretion system protein D n=1 Tax=Roseivivax jejudonensis TaxID=1529041 RepID=A0A1X6Y7T8_9RHOB|nr:type II secretion system secretin GspD [Roseivivax jejudonensis]SLN12937.1 Type II secretion system protein D precursor [Roseivivax jejudonensis]